MSTIKISELPQFNTIDANTANTLFVGVDKPSAQTVQFSAHTLARGLYLNETLIVGNNTVLLPNTSAQFSLAGESYVQTNFVNLNGGGTADHVITANNGTDSSYFLDLGFANPGYQPGSEFNNIGNAVAPLDGYLYVQGGSTPGVLGGNLIIGTTTANTETRFTASGGTSSNVIAKMTSAGFKMVNGNQIFFSDGTSQNTAAASNAYSQAAFALANTTVITQSAINTTQNTNITVAWNTANSAASFANGAFVTANSAASFANGAFATANTAVQNTAIITLQSLVLTGNLTADILYNTRSYPNSQTAVTLSFATDTWVRANIAANFAVTLSNFKAGSDIVLFITNTATGGGSAKTITHGCSALNSTVGATTFTLGGLTTARIKYYSFDGDLANTYASISYS